LNPSPSEIRVERTGAVLAASSGGDRADLTGNEWKLVVDLVEATRRVDYAGDPFRKPKRDAEGFEEVVSRIPAIAMDEAGTRIAWTTSGGAVLFLSLENAGVAPIVASPGRRDGPGVVTLSGEGSAIATVDDDGGRIAIYRTDESSVVASTVVPPSPARSVALNRDGSRVAIGMKNGSIALYQSKNGKWEAERPPWSVHASEVAGLLFSRDGRVIVSFGSGGGGVDRTVALSNASGSPDPRILQARQASGSVSSLSIGAASGVLAVGAQDGEVLMWSALDARYSGSLEAGTSEVSAIFVDETRQRLLTASGDGNILLLTLDPAQWVVLACAKANRNLSTEEWRELLPYDRYIDAFASSA
jgi:WD40 repeat protein